MGWQFCIDTGWGKTNSQAILSWNEVLTKLSGCRRLVVVACQHPAHLDKQVL